MKDWKLREDTIAKYMIHHFICHNKYAHLPLFYIYV